MTDELKFCLLGLFSCRMVVILDLLASLYLAVTFSLFADYSLPDHDHDRISAHWGFASWLLAVALVFCFLPPFNKTKLYFCWPLTAILVVVLVLTVPL